MQLKTRNTCIGNAYTALPIVPFLIHNLSGEITLGELGFYFLGRFIAYYGLMWAVGICVGGGVALLLVRRSGLSGTDMILLGALGLFGAVIGAKLLYLLVSLPSIDFSRLSDPAYLAALLGGGFVFYGGIFGLLPMLWLAQKKFCIPVARYTACCIGCVPLGHAFGRIGCFLVGCCYGIPYDGPLAVTYTCSSFAPNGVPLFPVQLFEALIEVLVALLLLLHRKKQPGMTGLSYYLALYAPCRFALEFLRSDTARGGLWGLSTSQIISVLLSIGAVFLLIRGKYTTENA